MQNFFREYLRDSIHLVAITPDGPTEGRYFGNDAQAAEAWANAQNAFGRNIYFTTNNVVLGLNKKPTKADIVSVRFAHVDIDPTGPIWNKQIALNDLIARGNPSFIIDSGNGLQAFWYLQETTQNQIVVEDINRGIQERFGADACWNIDRLMRVPKTRNYPNAKKREAGRTETQTSLIVPFTGNVFTVESLAAAFPASPRVDTSTVTLTDQAAEGYTGPSDDDALIKMMLASKGGMAAMFGDKATVADLWNANADVLGKHFPSASGAPFDHSAADASLMSHLAFWTGKNGARMDRLFRRSALMRDKYADREQYRADTIKKSVAGCRKFYDAPPKETPQAQAPLIDLPGVNHNPVPVSDGFMNLSEQPEYFKGCTYVMVDHCILTPSGELMKPDRFNAMYGGYSFAMQADGASPSKKAFECFTENRALRFPKVNKTTFNPRCKFGEIYDNMVNTYFPDPSVKSTPGDVTPMLEHVKKLLPNERDREIFWTWAAALVQNPGVKFQWAIFIQGAEGNGKGILAEMLKHAVGVRYYHKPFAADITNKFNDFMVRKLFIDVQEILLEDRFEVAENMKDWITSSWIEVQPKGGAKTMIENWANWSLTSNHKNAYPLTKNQRRIAPLFTDQQCAEDIVRMTGGNESYFPNLWNWCNNGGFEHLTHYLQTRPLNEEFNPAGSGPAAARAPKTSSTEEAEGASLGRVEQEILEAVSAEEKGFRRGWLSSVALHNYLSVRHLRPAPQKLKIMLDNLGYREVGRSSRIIMDEEGKRPILYIKRELYNPSLTVDDYCLSQGHLPTAPNLVGLKTA